MCFTPLNTIARLGVNAALESTPAYIAFSGRVAALVQVSYRQLVTASSAGSAQSIV